MGWSQNCILLLVYATEVHSSQGAMPESVKDRCTRSHEYIFLFSKSKKYYFNNSAIRKLAKYPFDKCSKRKDNRRDTAMNSISGDTGIYRNKRDVWFVNTKPCREAHFAAFPDSLIEPCVLAGCPKDGIVLDPFLGSGTTAFVALRNNRNYVGNDAYIPYLKDTTRTQIFYGGSSSGKSFFLAQRAVMDVLKGHNYLIVRNVASAVIPAGQEVRVSLLIEIIQQKA